MKVVHFLRWSLANLACMSMTFSSLAMGAESERISKQKIQQYLQEAGLNRQTTVGEFWEKTKVYYPGYLYKSFEGFALKNKNMQMPEMTISTSKATDGSEVPVLSYSVEGKNYTIQIYGEKNKWIKFNNVNIPIDELNRPDDVFKRFVANDSRVKNEVDVALNKVKQSNLSDAKRLTDYKKDFSRFSGFPRVTPTLWKSLNPEQRAGYLVQMRLMWLSAEKVLSQKATKTAYEKDLKKSLFEIVFADNAYAEADANANGAVNAKESLDDLEELVVPASAVRSEMRSVKPKTTPTGKVDIQNNIVTLKDGRKVKIPYDAKTCLVAGYVGAYGIVNNSNGANRPGCSVDLAIASYDTNKNLGYVKSANEECLKKGTSFRACNPMIYGSPGGSNICVDTSQGSFQDATTQVGPCDTQSPLSSSAVNNLLSFNKDYSNISPREKQLAAIEADQKQENYKLTQDFISGVLQKRDPILLATLQKGEWNLALDEELVKIQEHFEVEINNAIKTCEANIVAGESQEKKQKSACDQLHRRWLFTERMIASLRAKACSADSKYAGTYNPDELSTKAIDKTKLNKSAISLNGTTADGVGVCQCSDSRRVKFGESCTQVVAISECKSGYRDPTTKKCKAVQVVEKSCPTGTHLLEGGDENKCVCDENTEKQLPQSTSPDDVAKMCKDSSNAWKWILGIGVGLLAINWLWNRDNKQTPVTPPKPPLCGAGQKLEGKACVCKNTCPANAIQNPVSCGCDLNKPPLTCPAPKIGIYPQCVCPASVSCTPGQQIYNQLTCQCDSIPKQVICPDGSVAPAGNLNACPKCTDGSLRPEKGCPTTLPGEGGSGDNCPQGGCVGGVPTGK